MTTAELKGWVIGKIAEHPELKHDITDLFQLCLDEIEDGGSREHEIELCINGIEELIDENTSND